MTAQNSTAKTARGTALEVQQKRLPEGYGINTMVTGAGKTYLIETVYPRPYEIICRGQATPKQAVDTFFGNPYCVIRVAKLEGKV